MDAFFKEIVDSYSSSTELEHFASIVGLQDDVYVKERIFELKCQELFAMIEQDVPIPTPESMDADREPETPHAAADQNPMSPSFQCDTTRCDPDKVIIGPGPSKRSKQVGGGFTEERNYIYQMKGQRVFAKNKAVDTTYQVKFTENWQGDKLKDLQRQLHGMFDDVLNSARGDPTDLGRIVVQHNGLNNPIVIPLQPWEKLDADTVMDGITKVLNSNEELIVDHSLSVTIGSIAMPRGDGGSQLPITSLFGLGNSLKRKRSIFEVTSETLCLPISIGTCFLKTCRKVNMADWNSLIQNGSNSSIFENAIRYKTCPKWYYHKILDKTKPAKRTEMAKTLCAKAGIHFNRPMGLNDIVQFENVLNVNVMVISSKLGNKFVRVTDNQDRPNIFVYLVEFEKVEHYHGISSIAGFFGSNYFCEGCLKPYDHKESHSCESTCPVCTSKDCTTKNPMTCISCHRECRSSECFQRHKTKKTYKKSEVSSQCDTLYQCKTCKKVLRYDKRKPDQHQCGEWVCKTCEKYQLGQHWCYQRATNKEIKDKKFVFYDFETRQDQMMECNEGYSISNRRCEGCRDKLEACAKCRTCLNCRQSWCGMYQHVVNFAVLQSSCSKCQKQDLKPESKCENCGNRCSFCSRTDKRHNFVYLPCNSSCGFRERIFKGDDAANQFCEDILSKHCKDAILIAHNAKSFDLYPIMEVLINRHAIRPDKIIYSGTKIMYMHVAKKLNLTFLDSLNFLPMKLADIPKAFGLQEMCKGYFPHFFNRKENQHYRGSYPEPIDYGYDYMSSKDRAAFLVWHKDKKNEIFDFEKEMLTYCRNDVDLLRRGVLQFRDVMMEVTEGIDPFDYVTIAGACMGIFKTLFLREEYDVEIKDNTTKEVRWVREKYENGQKYVFINDKWIPLETLNSKPGPKRFVKSPIAMVPTEGYTKKDNYSKSSIQWLEWVMEKSRRKGQHLHIRHALNGGEFRIPGTNYRADGFDGETVYEFHGCVFHGCPNCFPHDRSTTAHPTTDQSIEELYVVTKKRQAHIQRLGYQYVAIWEHEFHRQLKRNPGMKNFVETLDLQERLNPRDSFFGGRTNAVKLHHHIQGDEKIQYYDFTSLYPWTNKYCKYPVGHPTIITKEFQDISIYFGIAKVKVLPPRGLFHPVLPYTSNGKLKFPLCRTCADKENQEPCSCSDDQRSIIGTWGTPELNKAIEKGYSILKTYEVYHFEESTQYDKTTREGGLFAAYVNTFLKVKQEASGWPQECETEQQKWEYIRNYERNEGIKLEYNKIKKNPGLRSFAKLCLNSFWGKFGQRLGLPQSKFIHDSEADIFFQILSDPRKMVQDFHILSPEILQLEWSDDPLFLPMDSKTNVFLASFTTMWARLKLYDVLEEVGKDCLYMDTDSIIFVDRNDNHIQNLPVGNYLGELTNEIPANESHIVEFVSGGPKNYAFRTLAGNEVCRVRGFTLNFRNSKLINFDAIKDMVVNNKTKSVTVTNPNKISRDARKRRLYNREENKEYKLVYTKRVVMSDLTTVPYGY